MKDSILVFILTTVCIVCFTALMVYSKPSKPPQPTRSCVGGFIMVTTPGEDFVQVDGICKPKIVGKIP